MTKELAYNWIITISYTLQNSQKMFKNGKVMLVMIISLPNDELGVKLCRELE